MPDGQELLDAAKTSSSSPALLAAVGLYGDVYVKNFPDHFHAPLHTICFGAAIFGMVFLALNVVIITAKTALRK